MISSLEDAIPFFMYWKQEKTPLHAMLSCDGISLLGEGYISECSEEGFDYLHAAGAFEIHVTFSSIKRVAFMTPEDFHRGSVRKGDADVPLKNGWILHTGSGGFMNFFEEDTSREASTC